MSMSCNYAWRKNIYILHVCGSCLQDDDTLTIKTYIDGHPHDIAIYCGKRKQSMKLMSSGNKLEVEFQSSSDLSSSSGFHASYKFVTGIMCTSYPYLQLFISIRKTGN